MKKALLIVLMCGLGALFGCKSNEKSAPIAFGDPNSIVPFYENRPMNISVRPKKQPARVGMLLPLSGKNSAIADDLRNAGILAQFELADENYTLSFYDTKGTAEGARAAFEQALTEEAQVILGPLLAPEVNAIRSAARKNKIPVFSFTSDPDKVGKGVYSLALTIPNQTQRIIRFACEKGAKRLAIMAPDNKAGDLAIDTAKKTANACGMEVTKLSVYNPTFINFEPYVLSVLPEHFVQVRKDKLAEKKRARMGQKKSPEVSSALQEDTNENIPVKDQLEFDALFIADDGNRLKSISSLFGLYDVYPEDVLFLGLSTWNEKSLSNEGSLKGAYFPLLPAQGYDAFAAKFKETYGKDPNRLASLAYDAVALSAAITANGKPDLSQINTPAGFLGTDGLFRFTAKGNAERLMAIYKIAGTRNFVRIEKPSASFAIEDWKQEQMQDIKIINEYEEEAPVIYEFEEETTAGSNALTDTMATATNRAANTISTSAPVGLASANLP